MRNVLMKKVRLVFLTLSGQGLTQIFVVFISLVAIFATFFSISFFNEKDFYRGFSVFGALLGVSASIIAAYVTYQKRLADDLKLKLRQAFIIYNHSDYADVEKVIDKLSEENIPIWIDRKEIKAGEVWKEAIENGLKSSSLAIVFLGANFSKEAFSYKELEIAIRRMESSDKKTSPIIPVLLEGGKLPQELAHIHAVNLEDDGSIEFLIDSVKSAANNLFEAAHAE